METFYRIYSESSHSKIIDGEVVFGIHLLVRHFDFDMKQVKAEMFRVRMNWSSTKDFYNVDSFQVSYIGAGLGTVLEKALELDLISYAKEYFEFCGMFEGMTCAEYVEVLRKVNILQCKVDVS